MTITDTLKKKLDELEIERHVAETTAEIERVVIDAVGKAGNLAHERRTDIAGWLDKAGEAINERTEGRYADQVAGVRSKIEHGVDKVASQRAVEEHPDAPPAGEIPPPPAD